MIWMVGFVFLCLETLYFLPWSIRWRGKTNAMWIAKEKNTLWKEVAKEKNTLWKEVAKKKNTLVYVYDLKGTKFHTPCKIPKPTLQWVYPTDHTMASCYFVHRLRPGGQHYTDDPTKADLFFVPMFVAPANAKKNERRNKKAFAEFQKLQDRLIYLNHTTAEKHFVLLSKTFKYGYHRVFCNPVGLFRSFMRVSYDIAISEVSIEDVPLLVQQYKGENTSSPSWNVTYGNCSVPNHVSMPYISGVHWSHLAQHPAPWEHTERSSLGLFIGNIKRDLPVRKSIQVTCRHSKTIHCHRQRSDRTMIQKKTHSIFCLEPGGDNPTRKSLADSISAGCIPVVFDRLVAKSAYSLFPGWNVNQSHLWIEREVLLSSNLEQLLLSVPQKQVTAMQQHLRKWALSFQYSLEDGKKDAIVTILNGLKQKSRSKSFGKKRFGS